MRARQALAWAEAPFELPRATPADLAALRRRLVGGAQEAVALDFLEDDLHEAEVALGAVTEYLGAVEEALRDSRAGKRDLLALAIGGAPLEKIEYLSAMVASVRRRLAQVASRLPEPPAR
jgi:hypothetical protein